MERIKNFEMLLDFSKGDANEYELSIIELCHLQVTFSQIKSNVSGIRILFEIFVMETFPSS